MFIYICPYCIGEVSRFKDRSGGLLNQIIKVCCEEDLCQDLVSNHDPILYALLGIFIFLYIVHTSIYIPFSVTQRPVCGLHNIIIVKFQR